MASLKEKGAWVQWRAERFGGFGHGGMQNGVTYAEDICNLRPLEDGTLCSRDGYAPIAVFDGAVRGAFCHESGGERWLYAVSGRRIYAMLYGSGDLREIGMTESEQGRVDFCEVDGAVLLMDGVQMMRLTPDMAERVVPYVPLYGDNWSVLNGGEVLQEQNILTDQIRVRYKLENNLVQIRLQLAALQVDRVCIDGVEYQNWSYDAEERVLRFGATIYAGRTVALLLTMAPKSEEKRRAFMQCRMAARLRDEAESGMLFGGGADGCAVFRTQDVSLMDRAACRAEIAGATALYLLPEGCLQVGDGIHGVTAMARQYNRLLLFTEAHTLMTDSERLDRPGLGLQTVNASLGCTAPGGALSVGNRPISICGRSLLRWTANTDEADESNAQVISALIAPLLTPEHAREGQLLYDRAHGEVWVYLPGQPGRVLLWNEHSGYFYSYAGVDPDGMLLCGEQVAFFRGRAIYAFFEEARGDTDENGETKPIVCRWSAADSCFSHTGHTLRSGRILLCAKGVRGQGVGLLTEPETGRGAAVAFRLSGEQPYEAVRRIPLGRFCHLRVELRADCYDKLDLLALCLAARR